jgi:uncharacterized protein
MKIAVIGGGASGMVTAYLLDKQGHQVTVLERQPILGGHIRTLNKNVQPTHSNCAEVLESGVLEFPTAFGDFIHLMRELEVELEPVQIGSGMFFNNGNRYLSQVTIARNLSGMQQRIARWRLNALYARSIGLWLRTQLADVRVLRNRSLSAYLSDHSDRNTWLKLLVMYSYSIPFELLDDFPAQLAIPMLREYIAVNWVGIKGGVYTYIEKILARFRGNIALNVEIDRIVRSPDAVEIFIKNSRVQQFDRVVFATPPDRVMALLADPTPAEIRRFGAWQPNYITSIVHRDARMYDQVGIAHPSEFDFFETSTRWGYSGYLNQLGNVPPPPHYFLSFQLEELIDRDRIVHVQSHHTPLYTTAAFRHRDDIAATNGEHRTYHVGAYLGDGLHGGAISSAVRVAQLIGTSRDPSLTPVVNRSRQSIDAR